MEALSATIQKQIFKGKRERPGGEAASLPPGQSDTAMESKADTAV